MKSNLLVCAIVAVGLVGCTIRDVDDGGGSYSSSATPSGSSSTGGSTSTSSAATEVAYLPGESTLGITTDGTYAYVSTVRGDGTGRILRLGDDGSLTLAPNAASPLAIVTDDIFVYYTDETGVRRVKKSGGGLPEDVTTDASVNVTALALGGSSLFFVANDGLHQVSKTGGASTPLDGNTTEAVLADASAVYWITDGDTRTVKKKDFASGAVTTLADGLGLGDFSWQSFAQDDTSLYLPDPVSLRLYRIAKADGAVTLLATLTSAPLSIAVDDTSVYAASESYGTGVCSLSSGSKTSASGGPLQNAGTLPLTGQGTVIGLAVDSSYIWFTSDDHGVYRMLKLSDYGWGNAAAGSP